MIKISQNLKSLFLTTPGHDTIVDAIRAFAVISTILFHIFAGFLKLWDIPFTKEFLASARWWMAPLFHAEKGVDAFFLLSGLVLGIPLFKKLNQFGIQQAFEFYGKRLFRIVPLFFVALVLYALAGRKSLNAEFFANLFFINNFSRKFDPIIPVGWSLTIEMQLYFLVPFYFWFIKKVKFPNIIFGLTVLLSFGITAVTLNNHPDLMHRPITDLLLANDRDRFSANYGKVIYESFANRYAPFVIGLWLAYLRTEYGERIKQIFANDFLDALISVTGFLFVGMVLFTPVYLTSSWYLQNFNPTMHLIFQVFSRQLFAVGLAMIMLSAWYGDGIGAVLRSIFSWNIWAPFSKLAFPMYLFHYPCIAIAALMVFQTIDVKVLHSVTLFQSFFVLILSCMISILVSIPLHLYLERKFMQVGKIKK